MSSGRTDSHVACDPEAARHHWTADRSLVHDPQAQLHMKGVLTMVARAVQMPRSDSDSLSCNSIPLRTLKSSARTEFSLPLARQLPLETLQTYPPPMMAEGTS